VIEVVDGLAGVDATAWDALIGQDNPFVTHAFLHTLEATGCVGDATGWLPRHLLLRAEDGTLRGAVPGYLKAHSMGEYIFDHAWADAAHRAGIAYYPKWVCAVPLTPATGPRLLVRPDDPEARDVLARAVAAAPAHVGATSTHALFVDEVDEAALVKAGLHARRSLQYHWVRDPAWTSWDDHLAALTSKRRKEVRRERAAAHAHGLTLAVEPGTALSAEDVARAYACYRETVDAHGAWAYLTERFFLALRGPLAPYVRMATARRDGVLVAMALAFSSGRHLYGRVWGALEPLRGLHFELCYYQFLAHAFTADLWRVEAGAQGEHKIARGFQPTLLRSAHRIEHPGLDRAVADFLVREAERLHEVAEVLEAHLPYRD
jgi:predicted N-acyltransferase